MYICTRFNSKKQMKKSIYQILSILLPLFLLPSCTDDEHVLSLLDHAEAVMEEHPDSAYTMLTEADSLIPQQSKKTRMRHSILMADANNKLYQPLPSDTLFQEVVDYYDTHGTPNQQLKAHYLLGCIYRDRNEAPQALTCYNDAVEKADTLSEDCDYTSLYKVYGQMADIYEDQVMPNEEIEALKQYSKYALKAGDIYEYIHGIHMQARAYNLESDTSNILLTEKKAQKLFLKYGFSQAAASAQVLSIYIHLARNEYTKAHQLMQLYETKSGLFDSEGNICQGREHFYYAKGLYYLGIHQLDSAELYFRKLLKYKYSYDGYRGLMQVCKEKGITDSIIFYAHQYERSCDTLITQIHAQATRQALGMYNYSRQQKIAAQKTIESEQRRTIIYIITTLFIIAVLMLYHLYSRAKARRRDETNRLNQQLFDLTRLYKKNQEELGMMDKDYSALKKQKQQELSELQIQLSQLQEKYAQLQQHEKFDALMQSSITDTIRNKLKSFQPLTEKECETLTEMFRQNMPILYRRMTDGQTLGTLEMRVAILTRMGYRPDDIATLTDTSRQNVSNARANANKKIFSDNSARTLFKNMSRL